MHPQAPFSADVQLSLKIGEKLFSLAKVGGGEIVFREAVDLPVCTAEIIMAIDGRVHQWGVKLVNGAVCFDKTAEIDLIDG